MTQPRTMRFAAVVVVAASYALVFRTGEARVAAQIAENARTAARLRDARAAVAARPGLEAERARYATFEAHAGARSGAAVARFVRDAVAAAAVRRSAITAIASAARAAGAPPLEITIEGRYADVLATVRALSATSVPATVEIETIARKSAGTRDATVTATVRASLDPGPPAGSVR